MEDKMRSVDARDVGGCAVFPASNVWNTPIDTLPVHRQSAAWVTSIGTSKPLHPDFSPLGGIPYTTVDNTQPMVPVTFRYAADSDPGPYPIPPNPPIEAGSDHHLLIVETTNSILYELFSLVLQPDGSWLAGSGAIFDLKSNGLRTAGKTSADAAGLPILPGLVRYDEVESGVINHAIRFTAPTTQRLYLWPARHFASTTTDANYPPMGARFRLKATYDISGFSAQNQVILTALKKYGMFVSDNGGAWFITGATDARWDNTALHQLTKVLGSNFEAVDESGLLVDPSSGQVQAQGQAGAIHFSKLTIAPTQAVSGGKITATVHLTAPASVPTSIALTSSNAAVLPVPAVLQVPVSGSSASVSLTTAGVVAVESVTVAGATGVAGGTVQSNTVTVQPAALTAIAAYGTTYATGNIKIVLNGVAPPSGTAVRLASSDTAIAQVPASYTVPAGAREALAPAKYSGRGTATITATCGTVTKACTFTR